MFIECCNKHSNQLTDFISKNIESQSNVSENSYYYSSATIQSENIYQSYNDISQKVEKQIEEIERKENLQFSDIEGDSYIFFNSIKHQRYHLGNDGNLILDEEFYDLEFSGLTLEEVCEHVRDYEDWDYYTITNNYIYFKEGSLQKRYTEEEVFEIYSKTC
ncbi:hypothetical protein [Methanobrevibacter gottschalkii]|uniref:hypothetical protein n=1 Tax=Methanobrevibacter gottschalkii TaxID=190974 RepID=UPI000B8289C6|nr:hypothetical protein [Methanobrevibacter gottschalkii]